MDIKQWAENDESYCRRCFNTRGEKVKMEKRGVYHYGTSIRIRYTCPKCKWHSQHQRNIEVKRCLS